MTKEKALQYYEKAKMEWEHLTPKKKAKKIIAHINNLLEHEEKDDDIRQELQNQLIILEELDSEEIEEYLDNLNEIIMKNCLDTIDKHYK